MESKLRTLEEAAGEVADGATVALGGLSMNAVPMAFVRELARRGVRDLTLVAIVHGMPVEWLVAGGCVRKVISEVGAETSVTFVVFEQFVRG